MKRRIGLLGPFCLLLLLGGGRNAAPAAPDPDPLPTWNAGPPKTAITAFVGRVTQDGGASFVPPAERIAVFDQDGTLLAEQPLYAQLTFALDRIRVLAPQHPEWKDITPFKEVLEGDVKPVLAAGAGGTLELLKATHAGMTTDDFQADVRGWLAASRHPRFKRPYNQLVYQPMLELLAYLRANGFKTYIVSGSGVEFTRTFAEAAYGIPPEQVIGSRIKTRYEVRDGKPVLVRLPELSFVDDKEGKPVGIEEHIGRRPIAAFGNSDGDFQMLQWTTLSPGPRLGLIVHHDDAEREWAYDRDSRVGHLDRALAEAPSHGWVVVSMKRHWGTIFKGGPAGSPPATEQESAPRTGRKD